MMSSDTGDFQVIVRRLGFRPADQFFRPDARDTMSFAFYLPRVVHVLETVKVDAKQNRRHEFLFIDAATIASSGEELNDAVDIIRRLRRRMVYGLVRYGMCGVTRDIWVNGERIFPEIMPTDFGVLARYGKGPGGGGGGGVPLVRDLPEHVLLVLSKIKPEHIAKCVA